MSNLSNNYDLNVGVKTEFLAEQSDPSRNRYVLETKVGSMSGFYSMVAADGHEFSAPIPPFTLSYPNALH